MKRFLTLVLAMISFGIQAQYIPNNSQSFQFLPVYNPAFTGVENFGDLKMSYRYQWSGFGENAPKFVNLSYNTRIKQPLDLSYNSLRISNPSMMRPSGIPKRKRIIEGLALNVFQSSVGAIETLGAGLNFSFNYPLTQQLRLAAGTGVFAENRKLDLNKVMVRDPDNDPYYNHLLSSSTTQTDLNVRAGLLVYSPGFYLGVSYLPLVYKAIKSSELAFEKAFYTASAQTGVSFQINPQLAIKPSVIALLLLDNSIEAEGSVKAFIEDKVWAGLTYRTVQSGAGMVGFNLNQIFSVSYAYELSLSRFQKFSDGSHELVLSLRVNNIKNYPQYTW